jgi:hypothetical protein
VKASPGEGVEEEEGEPSNLSSIVIEKKKKVYCACAQWVSQIHYAPLYRWQQDSSSKRREELYVSHGRSYKKNGDTKGSQ